MKKDSIALVFFYGITKKLNFLCSHNLPRVGKKKPHILFIMQVFFIFHIPCIIQI